MRSPTATCPMAKPAIKPGNELVAIIGMGCRLPGAGNVRELWRMLVEGGTTVGRYPGNRFAAADATLEAAADDPKTAAMPLGGFLLAIDQFDAAAFEISPREAMYLDPQHRLLLEVAWAALEDAGQVRQDKRTRRTGVFSGIWASDFENTLYKTGADLDFYAMTGSGRAGASGRLSFIFGFEGPSLTVDAACSSSLVAAHLACRSLLAGECDMALAGGANAILATEATQMFSQAGMLARDGRCKFGDANADGFVRSEGAGMVVLKRLDDALAAGDPVRAVIRGSAVSNDGRSSGTLMTPSREGQRRTLHEAWRAAGVHGGQIRFFEAHGTGTSVGDPVEIGAIADALDDDGATGPCWIGSIKSNIGHTESAAGVASLIKTVLALEHRLIPKSLLTGLLNPAFDWAATGLRLASQHQDLRDETGPLIAGVSSFGLMGTNAHLVVEECRKERIESPNVPAARTWLLPISGRSPQALDALLNEYETFPFDAADAGAVCDLCGTASLRRRHDEYRAAFVVESIADLRTAVSAARRDRPFTTENTIAAQGGRRIVFIAPGQGSQWAGMGRELFAEQPAFRQRMEECDAAIQDETGWSVIDVLLGETAEQALLEIDTVQPALFAIGVSIAALWRSWGIVPDAVVGHSMGEVTAACIAGALSLADAAAVICRRSRLMNTVRGSGAMLTVELSVASVQLLLDEGVGDVSIGASNSPGTTVISGDASAIERIESLLKEREIFSRRIKVDVASHSSQVDPILAELRSCLSTITPNTCEISLLSTLTGHYLSGDEMGPGYWVNNLRQPVNYLDAVETLARDGFNVFVELSPHPVLTAATEETLRGFAKHHVVTGSTRRGQSETKEMLGALATLHTCGCDVNWESLYPGPVRCAPLPEYPFQRERCWPDLEELKNELGPRSRKALNHPLLRRRFESSLQPDTIVWDINFDLDTHPFLRDHQVLGAVVLPAAAQMEAVLEAMQAEGASESFDMRDVRFDSALQITGHRQEFQLGLRHKSSGAYTFEIRSRVTDAGEDWTLGTSGVAELQPPTVDFGGIDVSKPEQEGWRHIDAARHYRLRTRAGIEYGPAFRLLEEAWYRPGESFGRIRRNVQGTGYGEHYAFDPAVLDTCFQVMQYAEPEGHGFMQDDTFLPVSISRLTLVQEPSIDGDIFCHARLVYSDVARGTVCSDLCLADEQGTVFAIVKGFKLQRVSANMEERAPELLFEPAWVPFELPPATQKASVEHLLVVFCDDGGAGKALAEEAVAAGARAVLVRHGQTFSNSNGYTIDATRPDEVRALLTDLASRGEMPTDLVHLWSLDQPHFDGREIDSLLASQSLGAYFIPSLIQAIAACNWIDPPRLWLVTHGSMLQASDTGGPQLAAAPLWGVGSVVAVEHPELRASMVDVSDRATDQEIASLLSLMQQRPDEDRFALRDAAIYVSRFVRSTKEAARIQPRPLREHEDFAIEVPSPGVLDNLVLQCSERALPGPGEVSIKVAHAGLNFIDVTKAMGIYPGLDPRAATRIGAECSGEVVAIGTGVSGFNVGDAVMGISNAPSKTGLLASSVCLPESMVFHKPSGLTLEQAAGFPIAFLTAHHSLVELAHIRPGEWVLVPGGAGGVGLAAIQIAQKAGGHVIATASTPEKREYLQSLGVEHVLPSRTLDFAGEVLRITAGLGVDIVLNSLAGEYITKGLELLKPFGRFIELGKRDIYQDRQMGLKVFRNNVSFHAVDLAAMLEQRPDYVTRLLQILIGRVDAGDLTPLPVDSFSASEPALPFHHMAQARHIGKIVLRMEREVAVLPSAKTSLFRKDATYLITGGLGGVGSTAAEWMAENGAGYLVLISRREANAETRAAISRIESHGARVLHARTDITDRHALEELLTAVRSGMPPMAGVLHAATVIDDALIAGLSAERFPRVMGPKVNGTWNLYAATAGDRLDFMVLFSSIAAVYAQPGQGSYSAANAFLDSFAYYGRSHGRNVTSINWGGWDGIGLTREAGTSRSVSGYGLQGFRPMAGPRALSALRRVLETGVVQAIITPLDLDEAIEFHDPERIPAVLRTLLAERDRPGREAAELPPVLKQLTNSASYAESLEVLQAYLIGELSRVLKLAPERIGNSTLFGSVGLDSLMTLEFVRRIKTGLGTTVPATSVYNHPTATALAVDIASRLQLPPRLQSPAELSSNEPTTARLHKHANALVSYEVSDDEALQMLMHAVAN